MPESLMLKFDCRLVSPYHTTQHTYRNLRRCYPHILGSSLRGTILSYLIQTSCQESYLAELITKKSPTEIQKFHRSCAEECILKDIAGEADWLPVFSFGEFGTDFSRSLQHRVGIDREQRTVAVGKIVSIEVVPEGTEFKFSITLPSSALNHRSRIEHAVRHVGEWLGVGHYKSLGFGRFEVAGTSASPLSGEIERLAAEARSLSLKLRLRMETPLVLDEGTKRIPLESSALPGALAQMLAERAVEIAHRFGLPAEFAADLIQPLECRFSFRPDYFSRNSFEEDTRKNALVALQKGWFDVSFAEVPDGLCQQLAVARVLGIGSWADVGFGRLRAEPLEDAHG